MSRVLDQKTAEEITYLPDVAVQQAYSQYVRVMEIMPTPASDVTTEQLACMDFMVNRTSRAPYADFSVWQKYGARCLRRNTFTGLLGEPNATYKMVEFLGPASFEA